MTRTPEQIAADDVMTEAICSVNRAYFPASDALLTDYVVVFVEQTFSEDGSTRTAVGVSPRDGDLPLYRTVGMLEYALARAKAMIDEPGDDE